jgi:dienelactone hydrolase
MLKGCKEKKNMLKRCLVFTALILSFISFNISASAFPLWGDLKPGGYAVGYRAMHKFDRSRLFLPERNYEGEIFAGERFRPLQIQFFYPAQAPAGKAQMNYGDYLNVKANAPVTAILAEGLKQRTFAIHDYYLGKYLQSQKQGLYERLLKMRTAAIADAAAAQGSFPVIIYGGGAENSTDENAILWEYLASHGYIVAVVPSQGADRVSFSADAAGLETQTRDMEFLLEQARAFPQADSSRIGAMGFSYGGQAALLMAMRNPDIDAVVGLDPSFVSVSYSQPLKNSPFYSIEKTTAPILEIHRSDEKTVAYDVTDALKYSKRHSFDVNGLNHIDFNNYALLYTAALPEEARQNSPIAAKKAVYEAMARYIVNFLNVYVKGDKNQINQLTKPAEWKGFPKEAVKFRFSDSVPPPPRIVDLLRIFREYGVARGEQVYRETQRRDAAARVLDEKNINSLGYALLGGGKTDEAIRVFQLNLSAYPRSANAYDSLADAYQKKGNLPCVVYSYRKALEMLPADTTTSEADKAEVKRAATERLNSLKDVSPASDCELKR